MYARCVHWLSPKDKTGAKLVSMHETVISPTEYRSRHEALRLSWRCRRRGGELRGRAGGLGGFLKSLGVTSGQDRSFRTASCGVAPGDAGGGSPFQGLDCHPDQIPRPPFDRIARIGRPAGAIFRGLRCPGSCLQPPRSRRGGGTAPVTQACHQARGEVRPRALTPHRHSRAGGNPYSPNQAAPAAPVRLMDPRLRGDDEGHQPNPSSQRKLGSQERKDHISLHRHPGLDPGSIQRLGRNLPVDAGTSPA